MEPSREPTGAEGLPVQGPHWAALGRREAEPAESAGDFVPLRLVLQPSGAVVEVNRPEMLVGRHSEADIRLPLPDVSRRHCRLQFVEGCWQVIDLNSLNGVHVNGEAVLQAPLAEGDLLRIGGFTFAVEFAEAKASTPPAGPPADAVQSILQTLADPSASGSRRRAS
jgi:pSer/pThr/pTyr-binding forkhead associated (FHA) protein